jgi:hypothetical protein
MANEEKLYYKINPAVTPVPAPPNGQVNASIMLVTEAGAPIIPNAALPVANGDYTLRVTGGPSAPVYSWVLEGT